jgi:hypothetical protein
LGLNAGLGNFGVTTMQIVIPLVMTLSIFGSLGGASTTLLKDSGWIFGKIAAGTPTWIQNAGFAWVLSLVPLSILCWFGMNNLKTVSPDTGNPLVAFAKITWLYTLAFIPSILGLYLYLPKPTGLGLISMWVAIPLDIASALLIMKLAAFGPMKENVSKQFAIFKDKHTWSLTALYIVTFGSFIGFSMALPLAMKVIFGISHVPNAAGVMQHTLNNPNAPTVLAYAWIGPFVGAAVRPIGGWISDKVGGSIVTQIISAVMVGGLGGRGLRDDAGLCLGHAGAVLPGLSRPVHRAVLCQRRRQRLDLPHHRRDLRQAAGRPGAGLDVGCSRLRCLRCAHRDRRPDQGRHTAVRHVRFRGLLCRVPGPELVVLSAPQRVRQESLSPPLPTYSTSERSP